MNGFFAFIIIQKLEKKLPLKKNAKQYITGCTPIWEGVPPRPRDFGGGGTLTTTTTALERGRGYPGHPFRPRRFFMIFNFLNF